MLLGSPPDMVHGFPLRGTDLSSPLTGGRRHSAGPGAGIHPCCSGLQVQGTAISPTSAVLLRAGPPGGPAEPVWHIVLHSAGFINPGFSSSHRGRG